MKCLIDGDVLIYQAGFAGQFMTEMGELVVRPIGDVTNYLDDLISLIKEASWSDGEPLIFITDDEDISRKYLKEVGRVGLDPPTPIDYSLPFERQLELNYENKTFIPNFRFYEGKTKPYKGNRSSPKPKHYYNIRAYLLDRYDVVCVPGIEADDALSLYQTSVYGGDYDVSPEEAPSVICSTDKDLRMIPGYHYTWPVGSRLEKPLENISEIGYLKLGEKSKLTGGGFLFFLSQMITGDGVDNIPGIDGKGPVKAYKTLSDVEDREHGLEVLRALYEAEFGSEWEEAFQERARLLWMVREYDEEGHLLGYDGKPYPYKLQKPMTYWRNI